ncbi:CHAPERONE-LIKE PROTEIN OF POR1 [Nymphaea thermarum]|nr:CHAPERONE-LIKE PROTEIN OF POR1 [Nymphaea thermarum]
MASHDAILTLSPFDMTRTRRRVAMERIVGGRNQWPIPAMSCPFSRKLRKGGRGAREECGVVRCTMDATFGGGGGGVAVPKFPRMHVWDPYRRLGVTRDASSEEIRGARYFLLDQYAGHEPSEESIEGAYEKIIMASFRQRKKTKINLKTRLKKRVEESPPWFKSLLEFVELPPTDVILRRFALFAFMGGWSITNSAETGPAFQVLGTGGWMDMRFYSSSIYSHFSYPANMESRTPHLFGCLCDIEIMCCEVVIYAEALSLSKSSCTLVLQLCFCSSSDWVFHEVSR